MLALLTLASAWLGYNVRLVHHRRAMRREIEQSNMVVLDELGVLVVETDDATYGIGDGNLRQLFTNASDDQQSNAVLVGNNASQRRPDSSPKLSWLRRLLGDVPVAAVVLSDESDRDAIQAAFPEANVTVLPEFDVDKVYDVSPESIRPR